MKLCYVANSRFPSERAHMTQIVHMCNAFAQYGHEVTLIVTDRKTDIAESPEVFFGVPLTFSIVRMSVPDIAGRSLKIPVALRPYFFFIQRIAFAYQSALYVKNHGITHLYGRDEWVLWFMSFFTKIPLVWESHEARYSFASRRLLKIPVSLVVISEGIRDFYIQRGIAKECILVAHDAVDTRFFEEHISSQKAREILNITSTKPVVMYIGGLEDWKGGETLFNASKNLDTFETYVIGGRETELQMFRQKYPHIHFLGPRPYRELSTLQQAADVLVIPNTAKNALSAQYTSPLKLFSYMTAKKVIVASRIPSITNILYENETYFFTADDRDDLQRVITFAIQHPEEAEEKAKRAYEKSLHYTWSKRAESILTFFMERSRIPSSQGMSHTDNKTQNQIIWYLFVGSWVAVFQYVTFFVFFDLFQFNYVFSTSISFVLTVVVSFLSQKNITFRQKSREERSVKETFLQQALFFVNALVGLLFNTLFMYIHVDLLHISPYIAQALTMCLLALYNFFVYRALFR
jgi:glycosyltransferase involved in cell wall biosynthesis/putative flippase GtrA